MSDECILGSTDAAKSAASLIGGYIVTGGTSRRMGRDKARLPWRGVTLVEWIAMQVRDAVGDATLVGAPDRYIDLGLPAIGEAFPGCGPLSGIEAALRHSPFDLNLVVACDMPLLESPALRELTAAALVAGADVCAAVNAAGGLEPLCAVYDRRILPAVLQALVQGRFRARDLLAQLTVNTWRASDPRMVTNANCPSDWDTLLRRGD
jgi:molybdopterin-guanine dinucleotide biosynthesis protein A